MPAGNSNHFLLLILRVGTFLCFAGWTWVHFYWEGPYGILLWQDATYALAERVGFDWDAFAGDEAGGGIVQRLVRAMAWPFLVVMILTLTVRRGARVQLAGVALGSLLLLLVAYCKYLAVQRQLPMLVEYGGQILMPLLLVLALSLGVRHRATVATAMVAMITTFLGHGCYALGLWPTPGAYLGMTTVILGVEAGTAKALLHLAGVLDVVVCVGIFVPKLRLASALYAAVWGLATAIARPWAGMSTELNFWGADQFLHEAVLRAPHAAIPLFLFLLWRTPREERDENPELVSPPDPASESGVPDKLDATAVESAQPASPSPHTP